MHVIVAHYSCFSFWIINKNEIFYLLIYVSCSFEYLIISHLFFIIYLFINFMHLFIYLFNIYNFINMYLNHLLFVVYQVQLDR